MPGTLTISTLSDGTNSTSATNPIRGSARAWVNWNGNGVGTINQSYNVSSVTYNTTGDYTINFTNAMPNANYAVAGTVGINPTNSGWGTLVIRDSFAAPTTTALRVGVIGYSAWQNATICNAVIFST